MLETPSTADQVEVRRTLLQMVGTNPELAAGIQARLAVLDAWDRGENDVPWPKP